MRKCVVEHDNKLYYCSVIKENPWPEKKESSYLNLMKNYHQNYKNQKTSLEIHIKECGLKKKTWYLNK